MAASASYTFRQQPRAVFGARSKYRPQDPNMTNIMSDKRILRGNTYAAEIYPEEEEELGRPTSEGSSRRLSRVRMAARQRARRRMMATQSKKPEEEALPSHEYLEELPPPPKSLATKTLEDLEMDLEEGEGAISEQDIKFEPKPPGTDVGTSVDAVDLLDFDATVAPILRVLVGKSLDQGRTEVLQEQQMKQIQNNRQKFDQQKVATFSQAQKLEAQLLRKAEEADRRIDQQATKTTEDRLAKRALEARTLAKEYYEGLQGSVVERLANFGHFYDPVQGQVESAFMPWVVEKVAKNLQDVKVTREAVDKYVEGAVDLGLQIVADKQESDRVAAEAEARRLKELEEENARVAAELEAQRLRDEEAARVAAEEAAARGDEGDNEGDNEGDE